MRSVSYGFPSLAKKKKLKVVYERSLTPNLTGGSTIHIVCGNAAKRKRNKQTTKVNPNSSLVPETTQ